ncbi:MAG: adenylate kinase [Candidatus Omnitrophota bacterium]|nr:MAG: adenylate kinase [Candidatus Omnitrophota bacterium]
MRLIFIGPPGAGKGTQAKVVCNYFNLQHISSGDLLREAIASSSPEGEKAKQFIEKGLLVPDEIVVKIVAERIRKIKGFVLDGFPRTLTQAEFLDRTLDSLSISLDRVFNFTVSLSKVIERLSGRRICSNCNAIYHIKNIPPRKEGICDRCGGRLVQREDDKEETVRKRLKVYQKISQPLIEYYKKKGVLVNVDGNMEVQELFERIKESLRRYDTH